ncbi:adenine deaminase [Bacillus tianshenii]|nr:adenine deaminase [Bacillus tianshenii]
MDEQKEMLMRKIAVANKQIPADTLIKNGKIIDIFNLEIMYGDVAIADGMIVGIGEFEGKEIIDAQGRYISPSFIDGHVHIESSMVTPSEFAKVVLPHGVTTVITDPHEIGNVSGTEGIHYMLHDSENIPLDTYYMLPSCVPATPFENNGAVLKADDLAPLYKHERVLGLAEVMDYPSVQHAEESMIDKLVLTNKHRDHIDGHLAGLDANAVNIYRTAGVRTDHECTSVEEALDRLRRGMYVMIREGSVAKDLKSLLPAVNTKNSRRFVFCTDDKHLDDLIEEGSVDHNVRLAIQEGIHPLLAIQMASLNTAECYSLHNKGAIAPGYDADFLLLDDLETIRIHKVYKSGVLVGKDSKYAGPAYERKQPETKLISTVHVPEINANDLQIEIGPSQEANIIEIIPNNIVTKHLTETTAVEDGYFVPSIEKDQLKLVVVERHKLTGNIGLGIVKGFGLTEGAIATTIAHDSHNIVATGTNDEDILTAINTLQEMNGGLVIIHNGKVTASLSLQLSGLMSINDYQTVNKGLGEIKQALAQLGYKGEFNPFLTLSFLTLPVIPALKLTDLGLFNVNQFKHIDVKA